MNRLTKGMYSSQFRPKSNLFGLRCGQLRSGLTRVAKNAGWYNKRGEKLGWGDLSADDFQRISSALKDGELFIVLGESDSFWNFVTSFNGPIGSMCKTKPTERAPGVNYVASKAWYAIAKNKLCRIDALGNEKTTKLCGLTFVVIKPDELKKLMTAKSAKGE